MKIAKSPKVGKKKKVPAASINVPAIAVSGINIDTVLNQELHNLCMTGTDGVV